MRILADGGQYRVAYYVLFIFILLFFLKYNKHPNLHPTDLIKMKEVPKKVVFLRIAARIRLSRKMKSLHTLSRVLLYA